MSDMDETKSVEEVKEEENDKELDADLMTESDVEAIVGEIGAAGTRVYDALDYINMGKNFDEAKEAMKQYLNALTNGKIQEFDRKNIGNKKAASVKVNMTANKDFTSDVPAVDELVRVGFSKKMLKEVSNYINSYCEEVLEQVYKVNAYFVKMCDVKEDAIFTIEKAYRQFASLYDYYNSTALIETVPVSKALSFEENRSLIIDKMNADLSGDSILVKYLKNTQETNASGMNELYVIDSMTQEFLKHRVPKDRLEKYIDLAAPVEALINEWCDKCKTCVRDLFVSMRSVVGKMVSVLREAIKTINEFITNNSEYPYAILKYPETVTRIADKYLGGINGDPTYVGTKYNQMAKEMLNAFLHLADVIAKNVPKWAKD